MRSKLPWTASLAAIHVALLLALAPGLAPAGAPAAPPYRFSNQERARCLRCHGMANFAARDSATGAVTDLHVDPYRYASSAHAALSCRSCHPDVERYPHAFATSRARVSCDADCHASGPDGRGYTHAKEAGDFAASVHASGKAASNPDSPTCVTCHGGGNVHAIPRAARRLAAAEKMMLCAACHDDRGMMIRNRVDPLAVASYRRSFHYKAIHFGAPGTAVCQDCHTVHRVLAKADSASSVAAARLPSTCGQKGCHPGARMNFAMSGANHLALRAHREPLLSFEESFFAALTAGTMAALVAGIVLDIQRRLGWITLAAAARRRAFARLGRLARALTATLAGALAGARRLLVD